MNFVTRLLWGTFLFLVCQVLVWYQINGQFLSEWMKKNPIWVSFLGIPISYTYIWENYHHKISNDEIIARNWNGGPRGYKKQSTEHYWHKVQLQWAN